MTNWLGAPLPYLHMSQLPRWGSSVSMVSSTESGDPEAIGSAGLAILHFARNERPLLNANAGSPSTQPRPAGHLGSLEVDLVTEEVVGAMREAAIRPVLLKGPALALWLYDVGRPRPYSDCDLLVSPAHHEVAERVLTGLDFAKVLDDVDTPGWRQPAHPWIRTNNLVAVDLHRTLPGAEVDQTSCGACWKGGWGRARSASLSLRCSPPAPAPLLHVAHLQPPEHGPGMSGRSPTWSARSIWFRGRCGGSGRACRPTAR